MSLEFEELTPHLWSAKCRRLAMNTGILHNGGRAALIDPARFPDEVEDIAVFCDRQQVKVETIVITHHHWDHVLGAARFPSAHVVTHQAYIAQTAADLDRTRVRYSASPMRKVLCLPPCSTRPCRTRRSTESSG